MRELVELLQVFISEDKLDWGWAYKIELFFSQDSFLSKMLELLKNVELPDNLYKMQYLEDCFEKFRENGQPEFTLDQLFEEKWLIRCGNDWGLNISSRSNYEQIEMYPSSRDEQIVNFLRILAKIPYKTSAKMKVTSVQDLPEDIVEIYDGEIYINSNGKYWKEFGSIILGKWWNEIASQSEISNEKLAQIEKWFCCWELLPYCWDPEIYTIYTHELFENCLEILESEVENNNWTQTRKELERKVFLEYKTFRDKQWEVILPEFPDTIIGRLLYIDQRLEWMGLCNPYQNMLRLFHVCVRLYGRVSRELGQRFLKCLSIPCLSQELIAQRKHMDLLVDCLTEPGLYVIAAYTIWQILYEKIRKNLSTGRYIVEECNKYLFAIMENNLQQSNSTDKWTRELVELLWFFSEEGSYGFRNNIRIRKYFSAIHEIALQWYKKRWLPKEFYMEWCCSILKNNLISRRV